MVNKVCRAQARFVLAIDVVVGLAFPNGTWGLTLREGEEPLVHWQLSQVMI